MPWPTLREIVCRFRARRRPLGSEIEERAGALVDSLTGEPNGEALWETVRRRVADEILFPLWREGRLLGSRPEEAFFVRCDRTTMTQADVDAGRLVALVGFAEARPAEFQLIRIERLLAA
jgi:phage tail sheath protein FI